MKFPIAFIGGIILSLHLHAQSAETPKTEPGVSYDLARYRKNAISKIQYQLGFSVPENKKERILGTETLTFNYKKQTDNPLQIDFKEEANAIRSIKVNNQNTIPNIVKEHILINGKYMRSGYNKIDVQFIVGDAALNRREDYMYTLFVPDRARTAFPCFDQPDLKARFLFTLTIPRKWSAIANGTLVDSSLQHNSKTYRFAISDILPTYLFSFAAGVFKNYTAQTARQKIQLLYRETDTAKIENSLDSIIQLYTRSIRYYQKWTGIPYPFQKYGMVAIPDFQFGGMEHPGALLFQNASLFLDKNATLNQYNSRSNLIAHEVAHQWFGDMVTMGWFTDVWMKEVFANFMADKSTGAASNKEIYDLKFLTSHFPAAYSVDRTPGANPIRQPLDNLQNAGMLYGSIIYDKAPIMMRQLEFLMGKENFRKGVGMYLRKYAYGNASWPDLIAILDSQTKEDLQSWNKVWVEETGRPVIQYHVSYHNNNIENIAVTQRPEYGTAKKIWKQHFQAALYYPDTTIYTDVPFSGEKQAITAFKGKPKPLFIQLNSSGIGYGVFGVDTTLCSHFTLIQNPVSRASAYISLYENMLDGAVATPQKLLDFLSRQLTTETTELNLRLIANYISVIYWEYLSKETRLEIANGLEHLIWEACEKQVAKNNRKILFECYENIFQSQEAYDNLYQTWKMQCPPKDIVLNDEDYTGLALALALRNNSNDTLLQQQLARIRNPDRINRFRIVMQAVSSDVKKRDGFFYSLSQKQNRTNESAVSAALFYLHHPLRQETSIAYLPRSLDLLQEIQKTSDIFFPYSWLQSTFSYYQNPAALKIVADFISRHPGYNLVLKNKILQTTDNLRRAQRLVVLYQL